MLKLVYNPVSVKLNGINSEIDANYGASTVKGIWDSVMFSDLTDLCVWDRVQVF